MAVYTDESEITDITIVNIKQDSVAYSAWLSPYLLRADAWFIERCEELEVEEADIITYIGSQKFSVISLLRYWVYIEVLTELRANGIIDADDYNSKIKGSEGYKALFENYNNKLSSNLATGLPAEINKISITGRRITLDADYEGEYLDD